MTSPLPSAPDPWWEGEERLGPSALAELLRTFFQARPEGERALLPFSPIPTSPTALIPMKPPRTPSQSPLSCTSAPSSFCQAGRD
jgi:hypothetical protein